MIPPAETGPKALPRESTCPACGHHVAVGFFDGGRQPLATVAWPRTGEEARAMQRLELDFVRCVRCGHISNAAFDYRHIPYSEKPNLMFNRGGIWSRFIDGVAQRLARRIGPDDLVVEVGHGEGTFLHAIAAHAEHGRYMGFDPHGGTTAGDPRIRFDSALFDPGEDLARLAPSLIVSRHVLEHLANPLGFVQTLGFSASWAGLSPLLYLEVPCVDRMVETRRTVDLYYEHNSHFTTASFTAMLERCNVTIETIEHAYGDEIIYAICRLGGASAQVALANEALGFARGTATGVERIVAQLEALARARVAIWGGTGKGAAFINLHRMDAARFPLVVDSDPAKAGTYVPGTGQLIRFRDCLVDEPVDVVIIPTHWRAQDICDEMDRAGIEAGRVLIEHRGELIDFHTGEHPYRLRSQPESRR